MDVFLYILSLAFAIAVYHGILHLVARYQKQQTRKPSSIKKDEDWDTEYLRTEAAKHTIARIVPCKYFWKTNPKQTYDGMRWHCNCGDTDYSMSLKMAEHSFDNHKTKKREETLAQIGRFK